MIPEVSHLGHCIAPDLIGMGLSDKRDPAPTSYRFVEHRRYLEAFLDVMNLGDDVTLVVQDWGLALGFDWAARHADRVPGTAYMEALVAPLDCPEPRFLPAPRPKMTDVVTTPPSV